MLDVGEGPARGQQIEQLAVERAFALVFQVMNGEAGDDGVERRDTPRPRRARRAWPDRPPRMLAGSPAARAAPSRRRAWAARNRRARLGSGVAREEHRAEDAIPRPQIEEPAHAVGDRSRRSGASPRTAREQTESRRAPNRETSERSFPAAMRQAPHHPVGSSILHAGNGVSSMHRDTMLVTSIRT